MQRIVLSVPLVKQAQQADCLAACAAMVLDYYGGRIAYLRLLKLLRVTSLGAPSYNILALAELGLEVVFKEGTLDELYDHLLHERPCITFVQSGDLPYWDQDLAHAVVVTGLDDDSVYLNDPAYGSAPVTVGRGDFSLAWLGRDEF